MKTAKKQKAAGNWKMFRGRVKEAWGVLTDDELDQYEGQRDQLIGYVEAQTGEQREAISRRLDKLSRDTGYPF